MKKKGSASWSVLFGLCFVCVVVRADLYLEEFGCRKLNPMSMNEDSKFSNLCNDESFSYKLSKNDADNFTSYVFSIYISYAADIPKPGLENNKYFKESAIELKKIEVSQNEVSSPSQTFDISDETIDGSKIDRCGKAVLLATLVAKDAKFDSPRALLVKDPEGFSSSMETLNILCKDEQVDISISFQGASELTKNLSSLTWVKPGPILPRLGKDVTLVVKNEASENFPARTRSSALFALAYVKPIDYTMKKYLYMLMQGDPEEFTLEEVKVAIMADNPEMFELEVGDSLISTSNLIPVGAAGSAELKPGEEIVIASEKLVLPKDVSVCNEAVLIVSVSCFMDCPDTNPSNNFALIPVNVMCEHYENKDEPLMCEVYPDWKEIGNNAWLTTRVDNYMDKKVAQYKDSSWIPLPQGSKLSAMENRKVALINAITNMEANEKQMQGRCSSDLFLDDSSRGSLQQIAYTIQNVAETINVELEAISPPADSNMAKELDQVQTIAKTVRQLMRIFTRAKGKQMNMFIHPMRMLFRRHSRNEYNDDYREHGDNDGYDNYNEGGNYGHGGYHEGGRGNDGYNDGGHGYDGYNDGGHGYDGYNDGGHGYDGYNDGGREYGGAGKGRDEYKDDDDEWSGPGGYEGQYKDEYKGGYRDGPTTEYPYDGFAGYADTTENPYHAWGFDEPTTKQSRFKRQSWVESSTSKILFPDNSHYPDGSHYSDGYNYPDGSHYPDGSYYPDGYNYPGGPHYPGIHGDYAIMQGMETVVEWMERILAGKIPKRILSRPVTEELPKFLNAILYSKPYYGDMFNMVDAEAEEQLRTFMLMILKKNFPLYFISAIVRVTDAIDRSVSKNIGSFRVPIENKDLNNIFVDVTESAKEKVKEFQKMKEEKNETILNNIEERLEGMELLVQFLTILQKPEILSAITKVVSMIQGDIFAGDTDCLVYGEMQEINSEYTCRMSVALTHQILESDKEKKKNEQQYTTPLFWKKENNNVIKRGEYCPLTGYYHWLPVAVCSCNHRVCNFSNSWRKEKDDHYNPHDGEDDRYYSRNDHNRWDRDTERVQRQVDRRKRQANPEEDEEWGSNDCDSGEGYGEGQGRNSKGRRREGSGGGQRRGGQVRGRGGQDRERGGDNYRGSDGGIPRDYARDRSSPNGRRRGNDFQESKNKRTREQSGFGFNKLEEEMYRNNMPEERNYERDRNNNEGRRGSGNGRRRGGGGRDRSSGDEQRRNREFGGRRNQEQGYDNNGLDRRNDRNQGAYDEYDGGRGSQSGGRRRNAYGETDQTGNRGRGPSNRKKNSGRPRNRKGVHIKLLPTTGLTTTGNFTTNGTLALKVKNSIGLACAATWTLNNTRVACSQMLRRRPSRFVFEIPKNENIDFGKIDSIQIMLGSLKCRGEEKALQFCDDPVWDEEACNTPEPVAILCA